MFTCPTCNLHLLLQPPTYEDGIICDVCEQSYDKDYTSWHCILCDDYDICKQCHYKKILQYYLTYEPYLNYYNMYINDNITYVKETCFNTPPTDDIITYVTDKSIYKNYNKNLNIIIKKNTKNIYLGNMKLNV